MNSAIVIFEKDALRQLDASTMQAWGQNSLQLLMERWEAGVYLTPEQMFEGHDDCVIKTIQARQDTQPDTPVWFDLVKKLHNLELVAAERREYIAWFQTMRAVVKGSVTGCIAKTVQLSLKFNLNTHEPVAWQLLKWRSDEGYDGESVVLTGLNQTEPNAIV